MLATVCSSRPVSLTPAAYGRAAAAVKRDLRLAEAPAAGAALGKLLHANPSGFPGHRDLNLADPAASAGGRQSVKLERLTGL
jgi:hypothetical protein